jgi:hypothetical protein
MNGPDAGDRFLEALRREWPSVLEAVGADRRALLNRLVTGLELDDPVDVRAALADELLDVLPGDHPVIEALRGNVMFGEGSVANVEVSLRRLRETAGGVSLGSARPVADPPDDFDRTVRADLRAFPAFTLGELDPADASRPGLIRLPGAGGAQIRLPAFQFDRQRRPRESVLRVNALLEAHADPWGVMCWWVYPHARLATAPANLLGHDDDLVVRAAVALLED